MAAAAMVVPLAVPFVQGPAAGAKPTTTFSIATSPVPVHGYGMSLFVTETEGAKTASLTITFSVTAPKERHPTQTHSYSFTLPAATLTETAHLAGASIKTGDGMAKQGAITMTLKKLSDIQVSRDDCGTTKTRTGTLAGSFRLVADTTFFHTVKQSSLPATLTKHVSTPCNQSNPPCTPGTTLTSSNGKRNMFLSATRAPSSSGIPRVSEFLSYVQNPTASAPASISHLIQVSGAPKTALSPSADLTSASLNGSVGKPYLTGAVAFAAGTKSSGACSKTLDRTISSGTVTGKLVAHFDSVGDRGFTAGKKIPATLIQTG
jgi:hypothetical protein